MFQIGDKVTTKNYGVCIIKDIEKKTFNNEIKEYFVLDALFKNAHTNTMKIYILKDKAAEQMRPVLSKDEVLKLIDGFNELEDIKIVEFRARRNTFEELYKTGDIKKHCQLIKSLYVLDLEFKTKSKTLPYKDREYFEKLKTTVYDEFANALEITPGEVEILIGKKVQNK